MFVPKKWEIYYSVTPEGEATEMMFFDSLFDMGLVVSGNCFKSIEAAYENRQEILDKYEQIKKEGKKQ